MTFIPKAETKAPGSFQVRYRTGNSDENALLRLALLKEWGNYCYQCRTPVTFAGAEIDHILPRTLPETELEAFKAEYLTRERAEAFDLNIAHNLAPICRKCNADKSDTSFVGVPALTTWLNKAHEKRSAVEKFVMGIRSASGVQQAMGKLLGADFSAPKSKECLSMLGPALIDRFRSESPEVLESPSTYNYRGEYSDYGCDEPRVFTDGPVVGPVILDECSRRAKVVLEDVFGWDFDQALDVAVHAAERAIRSDQAAQIAGEASRAGHGDPDVGSVEGHLSIVISEVRFDAEAGTIIVRGSYDADGSAEVAVADYQNDSGTRWEQWDADRTEGDFEVPLWEPDEEVGQRGVVPTAGDVELS
ncbi:hypothetical protein ERC79_00280 [Rhodococcus sp. ABRD24]|uniref:HNH endonuclease n=1 Tax=Rhodococcus sp. ABRD24 TaxID=2507582 RepID=UPI00103CA2AB|nr:hypothetical protein [Rhodococcus sp. ABRD24]QBJ94579.1 hypothetical protein ERC79_00280 [Rhodococcus sp. ABRD24]